MEKKKRKLERENKENEKHGDSEIKKEWRKERKDKGEKSNKR